MQDLLAAGQALKAKLCLEALIEQQGNEARSLLLLVKICLAIGPNKAQEAVSQAR